MSKTTVHLFPYLFQPESGSPIAAEWGELRVPENRDRDESRLISIPFVRFRSTSKHPGAPIVFLQGGPGESVLRGLTACWEMTMWRPPLEIADFIFIEQRGFGLSKPCLDMPGTYGLPLDEPGSPEGYINAHRHYLKRAVSFWQERGVDLKGYNVREMAADINDLREALGYEKISLMGGSFGTHHGFAMLRNYGSFIERALFFGVEGPCHTLKLPGNVQKLLKRLNMLVKEDHMLNAHIPNLLELMASVLERLEHSPVMVETIHPGTKKRIKITIGKYDLQLVTAKGMGSTPFLRALPARYLSMADGDFSWLADAVIRERVGLKSNLMFETTDCASGASEIREWQISEQTPDTLLGNAINEPFHGLCDVIGNEDMGDDLRSKDWKSHVPTLLVCGTLDVRTPISNAEELLSNLPRGDLLIVEGVSHDISIRGDHIKDLAYYRDRFFCGETLLTMRLRASFSFDSYFNRELCKGDLSSTQNELK